MPKYYCKICEKLVNRSPSFIKKYNPKNIYCSKKCKYIGVTKWSISNPMVIRFLELYDSGLGRWKSATQIGLKISDGNKIAEKYRAGARTQHFYSGSRNPCWRGGIANISGYPVHRGVRQHRAIVERFLGRKLKSEEVIHHINGIKNDNRIENLQIMTASEHAKLHARQKTLCKKQ